MLAAAKKAATKVTLRSKKRCIGETVGVGADPAAPPAMIGVAVEAATAAEGIYVGGGDGDAWRAPSPPPALLSPSPPLVRFAFLLAPSPPPRLPLLPALRALTALLGGGSFCGGETSERTAGETIEAETDAALSPPPL